jgi:YbbR domain-containing protein
MKRTWKRIYGLLVNNLWWKLLSLAIAVLIWALVASEPELSTFTTVRLEYKNLADDLEISSEPVNTVMLELRGPSGELHGATDVRPRAVLDMSNARPGERTYPIGEGAVRLPLGVRLVRAIPSEVRFNFEPRRTRSVPVEVRFAGQGQNGYEVAHAEVIPIEVQIVGPRSRVARVDNAVTDQIDVSSVVGTSQFHVNLLVEDPYVRLQGPAEATVQVTMKKK